MPDRLDEIGEVVEHAAHQVRPAALHQSQHCEIRIPVVDLAEASSRDDVWVGQRNQRRTRVGAVGWTSQDRPKRFDVLLHRLRRIGPEPFGDGPRELEVPLHERSQIRTAIPAHDIGRREKRASVHERLRVGEHPRHLHVVEQGPEVLGGVVAGRADRRTGGPAPDRNGQGDHAGLHHLKMIHSTPIIAARSTDIPASIRCPGAAGCMPTGIPAGAGVAAP